MTGSASGLQVWILLLGLIMAGCGGPPPVGRQAGGAGPIVGGEQRTKTIVFAITNFVEGIGLTAGSTTSGGWAAANEIHSSALVTADFSTRKTVGRLAERVPTIDDGSIAVLPDGQMLVRYSLRKNVTWQDGTRFTADDLVFSLQLLSDRSLGYPTQEAISLVESSEAADDDTFVLRFKRPYYLGASLGIRLFWPLPRHILEGPYERYVQTRNPEFVVNLPYWTSEYVNTGPFRVASWDPASEIVLNAYDGYFLGRPKADVIRIRVFPDEQTLLSNLVAGVVDVFPENTLNAELVSQLQQRWAGTGGSVYVKEVTTRFLTPQWRPEFQIERANLDFNVRAALYQALDRETLADVLQVGHREMAAYAILPPHDPRFLATKDAMRPYAYDPERAKAVLRDLGWAPGGDGLLHNNADGRRFRNAVSASTLVSRDVPAVAAYWRQIGLDVDEHVIPPAQSRNLEYNAQYPGYELGAQAPGDGILRRLDGPAASAATRWTGNRGGYDNPRAQELLLRYRSALSEREQFAAMTALSDLVASELPLMVMYRAADGVGVRAGIKALDDHAGGDVAGTAYGTFTRNSHLWDVQ